MSAETWDFGTVLRHLVQCGLQDVHTAFAGHVQAYDAATRTATVVPGTKRPRLQEDGSYEHAEAPALSGVPVLFPSGGGYEIVWPLAAGDSVLVVCSMVYDGTYLESGQPGVEAGLTAYHGPSSAYAIPGVLPTSKVTPGTAALTLRKVGGASVTIGDVVDLGAEGGGLVALAAAVLSNMNALIQAITTMASAGNSGGPLTWVPPTFASMAATKVKAT